MCIQISNPDEFDVMLAFPVERVTVTPFGDDGAFYSVALKRGKTPLQKFQKPSTLSASEMLKEFRDEVKKCVKIFTGEYQNEHSLNCWEMGRVGQMCFGNQSLWVAESKCHPL